MESKKKPDIGVIASLIGWAVDLFFKIKYNIKKEKQEKIDLEKEKTFCDEVKENKE